MIFLTSAFARLAKRAGIDDPALRDALRRVEEGSVDATLGSGLVKQRIATPGRGKSGGARAILFYKRANFSVFLHLFEKSEQANLTAKELQAYRDFAKVLSDMDAAVLEAAVKERKWRRLDGDA